MNDNDLIRKSILEHNTIVPKNIGESFEKAESGKVYGDPIGTIKEFKNGKYVKIAAGKWVPYRGTSGPTVKTTKIPLKFETGRDQRNFDYNNKKLRETQDNILNNYAKKNHSKVQELVAYKNELERDQKRIKSGFVYVLAKMHTNAFPVAKWENGKLVSPGHMDIHKMSGNHNEMEFYGMDVDKVNDLYNSLKAMGFKGVWKSFGEGMGTEVARIGWDPIYKETSMGLKLDTNPPTKEPWESWWDLAKEENKKPTKPKEETVESLTASIIKNSGIEDIKGSSLRTDFSAPARLLYGLKKLKKVVEKYKVADSSVGAGGFSGANSVTMRSSKSGNPFDVEFNSVHHGGYYEGSTPFLVQVKVGGALDSKHREAILKSAEKLLSKFSFEVPGVGKSILSHSSGTNWSSVYLTAPEQGDSYYIVSDFKSAKI